MSAAATDARLLPLPLQSPSLLDLPVELHIYIFDFLSTFELLLLTARPLNRALATPFAPLPTFEVDLDRDIKQTLTRYRSERHRTDLRAEQTRNTTANARAHVIRRFISRCNHP